METISIIIPCYNEEEAIPVYYETMVRQMDEMEEQQKVQFELIFVDDGSKDHSLFEMRRLAQKDMRCRYLSFSRNFGKEAAMYAGLQAAKGDYVTVMDVDLQDPPSLLPKMYAMLQSGTCSGTPQFAGGRGKNQILLIKCLLRCDQPPFQNRDCKRCTGLPSDEPQNGGCRAGNE